MIGGRRLLWGLAAGFVLGVITAAGVDWLAILGGFVLTAVAGGLSGRATSSRARAAVDGGWAGAIAAGVAWVGVVGAEVAIRSSRHVLAMAASNPMDEDIGAYLLGKWLIEIGTRAPVAFGLWVGGGALVGAIAAAIVGRRGAPSVRRLPATFAPLLVLSASAAAFVVLNGAILMVSHPLDTRVPGSSAGLRAALLGSTAVALVGGALWTGWCAGYRLRHTSYTIRTSGALLVGAGLLVFASLPLMIADPSILGLAGTCAVLGSALAILGYRRADGSEPAPSASDGLGEVLHGGLLAVILGFGALGGTTASAMDLLVVTHIDAILGKTPWSPDDTTHLLTAYRWLHALYGVAALSSVWAGLVLVIFPAIAAQRWFTGAARSAR